MDQRLTPANARAALDTLRGKIDVPKFVSGEAAQISAPLVDLLRAPDGPRERQVLLGDAFTVVDRHQGYVFGRAEKDGYCGYLPETALASPNPPTHWVSAPATHLYPEPRVQARELATLTMGAKLRVIGESGKFTETDHGFIPARHLRALGEHFDDPAEVASTFLGTPYLWGGNSRSGIDCSGLAQACLLACGVSCPGDSDMQEGLGSDIPEAAPLKRNDLLFWKGHVALVFDEETMIHATGHYMSTVIENTAEAIARIMEQGGGPVIARRRP